MNATPSETFSRRRATDKMARLARLRLALALEGFRHIRMVYAVVDREFLATLVGTPIVVGVTLKPLSPRVRLQAMTAFRRWMNRSHPDWRNSLDCVGVIDLEVTTGVIEHRHSGYECQFRQARHVG